MIDALQECFDKEVMSSWLTMRDIDQNIMVNGRNFSRIVKPGDTISEFFLDFLSRSRKQTEAFEDKGFININYSMYLDSNTPKFYFQSCINIKPFLPLRLGIDKYIDYGNRNVNGMGCFEYDKSEGLIFYRHGFPVEHPDRLAWQANKILENLLNATLILPVCWDDERRNF